MHNEKLDDPSNQETKEPTLTCIIGHIPNEATEKNDPKIKQQCNDGKTKKEQKIIEKKSSSVKNVKESSSLMEEQPCEISKPNETTKKAVNLSKHKTD